MISRKQSTATRNGKVRVERLNKAAFKMVEERAGEIAESLMNRAKQGHVVSARFLVELAEGNLDAEEALTMRPLLSLAMRLAEEPQWPSGAPDAGPETEDEEPSTVEA
jgi:hypothetical protein